MKNFDIITTAVTLIIKAAIFAAHWSLVAGRWSGKARRRSLEKLAAMDANTKDGSLTQESIRFNLP